MSSELDALIAELEALSKRNGRVSAFYIPTLIKNHLTNIVKNRSIVVTGDTAHSSIDYFINTTLKNIDKPRLYDFQAENVHEEDVIHSLTRYVPDMLLSDEYSAEDIQEAIAGKKWVSFRGGYDCKCYDCAVNLCIAFSGSIVKLSGVKPCSSNRKFTIEVDFPTGEVVYADWPARFSEMRNAGFISENDGISINYLVGQRQRSDEFANQQIFHQSVGNSCPRLWVHTDKDKVQIGGAEYDEEKDDYIPPTNFEDAGYFCTDLWWVTMIDKQFYDSMIARLPAERDTKYYEKDVDTVNIKPGRWRFTCNAGLGDDDDHIPYTTAEWIGPASDFVPEYEILGSNHRLKTLEEVIYERAGEFTDGLDYKNEPYHYDTTKFSVIDYMFNTIGNGLRSKGEFYQHLRVAKDAVIIKKPFVSHPDAVPTFKNPYPNFDAKWSLIERDVALKDIPTDWLEGVAWFYEKCISYFESDPQDYSYAYPGNKYTEEKRKEENEKMLKAINDLRKPDMTDEQWQASIVKNYEVPFNGNVEDFLAARWDKRKSDAIKFCKNTIKKINKELANRK